MGSLVNAESKRAGAEVVYGAEECYRCSVELLDELGLPRGVMPLRNIEECGRNRATGFVWMKQKAACDHFFKGTNTTTRYAPEITAYVEKGRMRAMTGVKSKQLMMWVPIVEMTATAAETSGGEQKKIYFKTSVGIGKTFPAAAFAEEEEEK